MIKKGLGLFFLLILNVFAVAGDYEDGKQYSKIGDNKSASPQVTEFFSYYCPVCYRFEPLMVNIRAQIPVTVKFSRNHVDFLTPAHAPSEIQTMMTKVLAVTEALDQEQVLTARIFDYIHQSHAGFNNINDVRNLLVLSGVDGNKFDELFASFGVDRRAKQMKDRQEEYTKQRILTGVPTIIVNDKYRVNAKELDREHFEQDYINLVNYLLTLD
jgi:protein dithiol oxidoreductase (disulfide-forming)